MLYQIASFLLDVVGGLLTGACLLRLYMQWQRVPFSNPVGGLVFALTDLPEMAKGKGVRLQKYKDGGLSDAITFRLEDGLSWTMGGESGRTRTERDMGLWRVARGAAGRLPPQGFPRNNRFD